MLRYLQVLHRYMVTTRCPNACCIGLRRFRRGVGKSLTPASELYLRKIRSWSSPARGFRIATGIGVCACDAQNTCHAVSDEVVDRSVVDGFLNQDRVVFFT